MKKKTDGFKMSCSLVSYVPAWNGVERKIFSNTIRRDSRRHSLGDGTVMDQTGDGLLMPVIIVATSQRESVNSHVTLLLTNLI